jgi:hypothetical protein
MRVVLAAIQLIGEDARKAGGTSSARLSTMALTQLRQQLTERSIDGEAAVDLD